jgi:hypothetical protein
MSNQPLADPLALWRGIDDAVAREAVRRTPPRVAAKAAQVASTGLGQGVATTAAKRLEPV